MRVEISGLPFHPVVNKVNFSRLSAAEHKQIIHMLSPHNYHQIRNWMVVEHGNDGRLRIQKTLPNGREQTRDVWDCQAMYSACNFGNGPVFEDIVEWCGMDFQWATIETPAVPRAFDHRFLAPALTALKTLTGIDGMFIMKSGGTEIVETGMNTLLKFFFKKHGGDPGHKPIIITPTSNFHGRTRGSRFVSTSLLAQEGFYLWSDAVSVLHVPFGDADAIEQILSEHQTRVAFVLLEPIQGEAGVIIPPEDYLKRVSDSCKKYDVPLMLDEIQTGFGRTGTDFVYERYGVIPDMLCLGKALGAGIMPVSALAGRRDIMETIEQGSEGATWSGAPFQCVALMAAIKALSDYELSAQSERKGILLLDGLKELQKKHPSLITAVRGKGLFVAIETPFEGEKVSQALLDTPESEIDIGVWAKETGKNNRTIRISPYLTIPEEAIPEIVNTIEKTLLSLAENQI